LATLDAVRILRPVSSARRASPFHSCFCFSPDPHVCYLGKTSLLSTFASGKLANELVLPIFPPSMAGRLKANGRRVEFALWDTVDLEDYHRLRPLSYSDSHIILICYAIDALESLTSVMERASTKTASSLQGLKLTLGFRSGSLRLVILALRHLCYLLAARQTFAMAVRSSSGKGRGTGHCCHHWCHPNRYAAHGPLDMFFPWSKTASLFFLPTLRI